MEQQNPIEEMFEFKGVTDEDGVKRLQSLREAFSAIYRLIEMSTPNSRERSLAITNLEQAAMWASKSITHGKEKLN